MFPPIDDATFLYLMSSLIQVFGTLVAADTIFLVILHEFLIRRMDQLLIRLGMMVEEASGYTFLPSLQGKDSDQIRYKAMAEIFIYLDYAEIEKRIDRTKDILKKSFEAQNIGSEQKKKREEGYKYFESLISRLDYVRKKLGCFPNLVFKVMTGPALLSFVFSIFLLCFTGDQTGYFNMTSLSWVSVTLAFIGFAWVIYWAIRSWPKLGN